MIIKVILRHKFYPSFITKLFREKRSFIRAKINTDWASNDKRVGGQLISVVYYILVQYFCRPGVILSYIRKKLLENSEINQKKSKKNSPQNRFFST